LSVFIIRRLLQSALVVVAMSLIVFLGVFVIGNPVDILINPEASQAEREAAIAALGLDRPVWSQYGAFVLDALGGNLGNSFVFNEPALSLIVDRLPATLELALTAMLIALVFGIPLGVLAGARPASLPGRLIQTGSILGFSLPNFWQGLMLIMIFAVLLGWLPSGGRGETGTVLGIETSFATWDGIRHLILPAMNLALFKLALIIRLTSSAMRETLTMDFIDYARAKGLRPERILGVHALKNIMVPIVTVTGLEFGSLIAFAVVTETVFSWPGMGKLIIDSITVLDRPVIVAYLMVIVLMFITINLIVDIAYSALDPRVRLEDKQ
jgi:peptide/nickel transport system permease protein